MSDSLELLRQVLADFPVIAPPSVGRRPGEDGQAARRVTTSDERLVQARTFHAWRHRLHAAVQLHRRELPPRHAARLEQLTQDLLFVPSAVLHADDIDLRMKSSDPCEKCA